MLEVWPFDWYIVDHSVSYFRPCFHTQSVYIIISVNVFNLAYYVSLFYSILAWWLYLSSIHPSPGILLLVFAANLMWSTHCSFSRKILTIMRDYWRHQWNQPAIESLRFYCDFANIDLSTAVWAIFSFAMMNLQWPRFLPYVICLKLSS